MMTDYLSHCESHLQNLISATSRTGGAMWPSVLDTRTGIYPEGDHVPQRVYRLIGAPRGSTLYWDQPTVVAAETLSELTGDRLYSRAVDRYVDAFLSRCVAENGMFLWGNHCYYDVIEGRIVSFSNGHHELRPISPAWDVFWRHDPEVTEKYIRTMAQRHVYEPATGGFNRHDDGKKGHAFLEAGGILAESLGWLYGKTGDRDVLDGALRIARYSYNHRDPSTGLVPNEPDQGRWDSRVCTSEIGLWARCLLRAEDYAGKEEFVTMARHALRAYLEYAYDEESGRYFGQVDIRDGSAVIPEHTGYWPGRYSDLWNTDQWPHHDYPAPAAEACLSLYRRSGEEAFLDHARRWANLAVDTSPGTTGSWAYAESHGRCIHFLTRAGLALEDDRLLDDARDLADEAVDRLWNNGLFAGYPGDHLYESVDGVGFLLRALMFLQTRQGEK
jgi:hypothetical protein